MNLWEKEEDKKFYPSEVKLEWCFGIVLVGYKSTNETEYLCRGSRLYVYFLETE